MSNITVIDLNVKDKKIDEKQRVSNEIKKAYTEYGFSILVNHGIDEAAISDAFEIAKVFHSLPFEEKIKIKQNDSFRGYMPLNKSKMALSTLGETKAPNQLESFIMAFEPSSNMDAYNAGKYLYGDNQFPPSLPSLRDVMYKYRDEMLLLSQELLRCFSLALGQKPDHLDKYFNPPTFFLRLQKYPIHLNQDNIYGIAPHTDYGFFTFVAQNQEEGLEIQDKSGKWLDVPIIKNSLVLNTGDMCKRISNDSFKSTPHRVINKSNNDRYSIPFFFEPNMFAQINTIHTLGDGICKHQSVMYGDYLMERINANYGLGKK